MTWDRLPTRTAIYTRCFAKATDGNKADSASTVVTAARGWDQTHVAKMHLFLKVLEAKVTAKTTG